MDKIHFFSFLPLLPTLTLHTISLSLFPLFFSSSLSHSSLFYLSPPPKPKHPQFSPTYPFLHLKPNSKSFSFLSSLTGPSSNL